MSLIIAQTYIRRDEEGRLSLNDLHEASGGDPLHHPEIFLRMDQTLTQVAALDKENPVVSTDGRRGSIFVEKDIAYEYAPWISKEFHELLCHSLEEEKTVDRVFGIFERVVEVMELDTRLQELIDADGGGRDLSRELRSPSLLHFFPAISGLLHMGSYMRARNPRSQCSAAGAGWLYVFYSPRASLVKIGRTSSSVEGRLRALRGACPDLEFAFAKEGAHKLERLVHTRLEKFRVGGEWFEVSVADAIRAIEEVAGSAGQASRDVLAQLSIGEAA